MIRRLVIITSLLGMGLTAQAKDLGNYGETFDIAEIDMLAEFQRRIEDQIADGRYQQKLDALKNRTKQYVVRPRSVIGIEHGKEYRQWVFDPTLVVEADITDQNGRVLFPAGTEVNPLRAMPIKQILLFIDGDSPDQVAWAISQAKAAKQAKIILTNGAPFELMKKHDIRFFFDQDGFMVKRFGITHVPAKAREGEVPMQRDGQSFMEPVLFIEEFPSDDLVTREVADAR